MFTGKTAPVCLFVYKRPDILRSAIDSLRRNDLAACTDLYVFSDGAAGQHDRERVAQVRQLIGGIKGFRSVHLRFSPVNKGLADSILAGVTEIVRQEGKVIVLEDDLLVTSNFLSFMNAALEFYRDREDIFSIAGYSSPLTARHGADVYFTRRASSWGWGTWEDRWRKIDWSVNDFPDFSGDKRRQKEFNKMGSDLSGMLKRQMTGKINSWAIRWTYHQFRHNLFTVFPTQSKVANEGFGDQATHTGGHNRSRFFTFLDRSGQQDFHFPDQPVLDPAIIRQFTGPYSLRTRAWYKLKDIFSRYNDQLPSMTNIIATWVCVDTKDNGTWFPSAKGNSADSSVQDIYWRCTACFFSMARFFNPDATLMLFSNIDRDRLQQTPVGHLLGRWRVEFHRTPFEYVTPPGYFDQWRNQFYEFSIFDYVSAHPGFENTDKFLLLDSDCIITADLSPLFWAVDRHRCISYIIDYAPDHLINGNSRRDMQAIFGEMSGKTPSAPPDYHAGEFFAATVAALRQLSGDFYPTWEELMQRHGQGRPVLHEEAHVLSYLFYCRGFTGGQANGFVKRLWTDPATFRNVEEKDAGLPVWHLPAEKRTGFRKFFDWLQANDFNLGDTTEGSLLRRLRYTFNVPDIPLVKQPWYLAKKVAKKIIG